MPVTHVYDHPDGLGLGQHHAGDMDLAARPAQPPEAAAALRAALEAVDPTDEQRAKLDALTGRTMADLDMAHGTKVEHVAHDDERNIEIVEWTDRHGDERVTGVSPEMFASHFREVSA